MTLPNKLMTDRFILGRNPRVVNGHVKSFLFLFTKTAVMKSYLKQILILMCFSACSSNTISILETGEWCRCRSLPITPPASLRSHGSRPRPTRHIPPSPLAGWGVLPRLRSTPPLSRGEPVRVAAAYLGVRTDEAREKEMEG